MSKKALVISIVVVIVAFVVIAVAQNMSPTGQPVPTIAALVGGTDGTNIRALLVDSTGRLAPSVPVDPCSSSAQAKSSVAVAIGSATTTQIVALSGTTKIYVCHFDMSVAGTSPSVLFEYGTGASCGTGTTTLTGTYLISIGNELSASYGGTIFSTAAGNALCIVSGGTTPSIQGVVTYVQL